MRRMREVLYRIFLDPEKYRMEKPVRMALLSDLHNNEIGKNNAVLLKRIQKFAPDFILAAGDLIVGAQRKDTVVAENLMKTLAGQYPVYYANGNHEHRMKEKPEYYGKVYESYSRCLGELGVHLLENQREEISVHGMKLEILGLELEERYFAKGRKQPILTPMEMEGKLGRKKEASRNEESVYTILLAHNPVYFPTYAAWGADLVCAGHLHGGIVRIPGIGGILSPQLRLFPKYDRGRYQKDGSTMIVSAGLGMHTIPVRPFNPIELVKIELTNSKDEQRIANIRINQRKLRFLERGMDHMKKQVRRKQDGNSGEAAKF